MSRTSFTTHHPVNARPSTAQALLLMLGCSILMACKHEPPVQPVFTFDGGGSNNGGGDDTSVLCDPNVVYFEQQVLPMLVSNCAIPGCHDDGTHEDGIRFTSFSAITGSDVVDPFDAEGSDIIEVITETDPDDVMPPPPHTPLTAEQIATLIDWIEQGAQNNSCVGTCDTANAAYSTFVAPLLAAKCIGCHSGSAPQGGLNFTAWPVVNMVALDGRLAGAVQHQSGYSPMPPSGNMLSGCEIDRILTWIQDGAPND